MRIEELVEEVNQFIEDDERKIRVEDAKAALSAASPASRQVPLPVARWLALQRRRLSALEKRLSQAAQRYFARAGT
jgi:hypothetical protein